MPEELAVVGIYERKQENTLSTKKAHKKKRKNINSQEKKKENTLLTNKVRFKKIDNNQEKRRKEMENAN